MARASLGLNEGGEFFSAKREVRITILNIVRADSGLNN